MRRVAGGAERDAQRRAKFVVFEACDEPIDHPRGVVEISVEQNQRERAVIGTSEQIGVAHFLVD